MKTTRSFIFVVCTLSVAVYFAPSTIAAQNPATSQRSTIAQQTGAPKKLPDVVVRGSQLLPLTLPTLAVSRREIARIPGGAAVTDAERYKTQRVSNLRDALGLTPGVYVQSRFGAEEARLSIRGSGIQRTFHGRGIVLLQDGFRLNETDGGFDFQAIEPLVFSHIETYRGANALRYGATTLGGAINFISPTGYTAPLSTVRGEIGSYGYRRGLASVAGHNGNFDGYFALTYSGLDGFRDHARQSNTRLFSNVGWKWSPALESRLYIYAAHSDSYLPGSLTKQRLNSNPRAADPANVVRIDKRDFDYFRVGLRNVFQQDDHLIEAAFSWAYKDLDHPIFNILTPTFATGPGTIDLQSNNYLADLRYTYSGDVFSRRNRLTVGFNFAYAVGEDSRFENLPFTEVRGRRFADGTEKSQNLEVYFENEHALFPKLALIAGFQAVEAERNFTDHYLLDGNGSRDQTYSAICPKVGLRYDFLDTASAFINFSRSFEPPSFGEIKVFRPSAGPPVFPRRMPIITTQPLAEQTAWTLEVGTRGEYKFLSWDLAWYHSWVENEQLALNDSAGNPLGTINADKTIHHGVEFGLQARLWQNLLDTPAEADASPKDQLVLRQSYLFQHFAFDNDRVYGDRRLAGLPRHFYRAELQYEHSCGFYIGPTFEWSPEKYPIDHANTFYADAHFLIGAKVGYRTQKGLNFFAEARNLFDETYAAATGVIADAKGVDSAAFLPGDGRTFYAGIEYKW